MINETQHIYAGMELCIIGMNKAMISCLSQTLYQKTEVGLQGL